jgi:hypothetical protein
MKQPLLELFNVPDYLTVDLYFGNFRVRCDLCDPGWSKTITWNPNKRPREARCADCVHHHLRHKHNIKVTSKAVLDLVNAAAKKTPTKSVKIDNQPNRFSPYSSPSRL